MAYPTESLAITSKTIDQLLIRLRQSCVLVNAQMAAGDVNAGVIMGIRFAAKSTTDQLNALKTQPGLAAYVQNEKNDGTLDIVAEFNAVLAALADVVTTIETLFPADGGGYLLREQWDPTGPDTIQRMFTPAQTAAVQADVSAIIATINV